MPISKTVAITWKSASQMWLEARWLCTDIFNIRKSTQLEENLNVLPGMSGSYTITKKKLSKRPDSGVLVWNKGGPRLWALGRDRKSGKERQVSNLQRWLSNFSSAIRYEGSSHSLYSLCTPQRSLWHKVELVRHEPSWVLFRQRLVGKLFL